MRSNYRAIRNIAIAASMVVASVSASQAWEPTEEVELVTHTGTTSSTWTNADMIALLAEKIPVVLFKRVAVLGQIVNGKINNRQIPGLAGGIA